MFNPDLRGVLKNHLSRYSLVTATAKRARQIIDGAEPLCKAACNKPLSEAVEEFYAGKVKILGEDSEAEK